MAPSIHRTRERAAAPSKWLTVRSLFFARVSIRVGACLRPIGRRGVRSEPRARRRREPPTSREARSRSSEVAGAGRRDAVRRARPALAVAAAVGSGASDAAGIAQRLAALRRATRRRWTAASVYTRAHAALFGVDAVIGADAASDTFSLIAWMVGVARRGRRARAGRASVAREEREGLRAALAAARDVGTDATDLVRADRASRAVAIVRAAAGVTALGEARDTVDARHGLDAAGVSLLAARVAVGERAARAVDASLERLRAAEVDHLRVDSDVHADVGASIDAGVASRVETTVDAAVGGEEDDARRTTCARGHREGEREPSAPREPRHGSTVSERAASTNTPSRIARSRPSTR